MFLQRLKQKISEEINPDAKSGREKTSLKGLQILRVSGKSPFPRVGVSATHSGNTIYLFGGMQNQIPMNDLSQIALSGLSSFSDVQCTGSPPTPRLFHTATLIKNKMYLYGGIGSSGSHDTSVYCYALDSRVWTRPRLPSSFVPAGRHGHSACVVKDSNLYIFGGQYEEGYLNDLLILNINSLRFESVSVPADLTVRAYHSMDIYNDNLLLVFGGECAFECMDDLWIFDTSKNRWNSCQFQSSQNPCARYMHASTVYGNNLLIVGGKDFQGRPLSDIWCFSLDTLRWRKIGDLPWPVAGARLCLNKDKAVIVGGHHEAELNFNYVYALDLLKLGLGKPSSTGSKVSPLLTMNSGLLRPVALPTPPKTPDVRPTPPLPPTSPPPPPNFDDKRKSLPAIPSDDPPVKDLVSDKKRITSMVLDVPPPKPISSPGIPPPPPPISPPALSISSEDVTVARSELDLVTKQLSDEKEKVQKLQQQVVDLKVQCRECESKCAALERKNMDIESNYSALESENKDIKSKHAAMQLVKEDIESKLFDSKQNFEKLQEKLKKTEEGQLLGESKMEEQIEALNSQLSVQKELVSKYRSNSKKLLDEVSNLRSTVEELQCELEAKSQKKEPDSNESLHLSRIAELEELCHSLKLESKETHDELDAKVRELSAQQQAKSVLEKEMVELNEQIALLQKKVNDRPQIVSVEPQSLNVEYEETIRSMQEEIEDLKKQLTCKMSLIPSIPPMIAPPPVAAPPPPPPPPPPMVGSRFSHHEPLSSGAGGLLAELQNKKNLKPVSIQTSEQKAAAPVRKDPMAMMIAEMQAKKKLKPK